MKPSLEWWPTKAKEAPSPHEVKSGPAGHQPTILMFPFYPSNDPENQKFKKNLKNAWGYYSFIHTCVPYMKTI